jgi:hypothetical protein
VTSRGRIVVLAAAAAAAAPVAALATGAPPLPGWLERMMGQAPPAMQQMMRSPEMRQQMSSPEVEQEMEQMMRSPEMEQMMIGAGSGSAGMDAMMAARPSPAQGMAAGR